jgi:hypothetical protein
LLDFGRFAEVKKYTDEMLDMGIELPQSKKISSQR